MVNLDFVVLKIDNGNCFQKRLRIIGCLKQSIFIRRMNYLAHAYLSFNNPEILVGNMISDFIKGKKQFDFPLPVQKGIKLHRAIDEFTDSHHATRELKSFFRPQYRLYSGAFADVVYDHFLANDTHEFKTEQDLHNFSETTYQMLEPFTGIFPIPFKNMFPYMKTQNWLYNYRYRWGIEKSFGGVVRRSAYLTECAIAFDIFNTHNTAMQVCYNNFFPDLKKYSFSLFDELLNTKLPLPPPLIID
jgi:acyl carrier protein phosphodiesterase